MAKLYPPNIAGTLPSFYIPEIGDATLVVPFSMNKTVSVNQIKDFSLRIKTTNTDILYGVLTDGRWNAAETTADPRVSFLVPQRIINKLVIGQYYKLQLAYIDKDGVTGYYSTVGIMKFTAQPRLEISGFNPAITNLNRTEYVGVYHNQDDPSEKVYQYKFSLYDRNNNLLETSGWRLHNSYEDTSLTESTDSYVLKYAMKEDVTYRIRYSVITNNNLEVSSPSYLVMNSKSIDPEVRATLTAKLDYENACIDLELVGEKDAETGKEYAATGTFLLSRASSLDNYSTWLTISNFKLTGELPSAFLFRDYTIEQGATYIYSLQQYNDYGIYSNRLLTEYVEGQFEDAYLFDGERQLKIRFNPKISSFKSTVLESKKTTIGSKYPFIFRNGAVEYKEFPINGLISYMMDNDEFFLSLSKDLYLNNWQYTTNITDENVMVERLFKLEVLKWLNNGKVKLFKSPQEGNYIVRLMNVSATPIDTVSRMLHNFSCQASEVADYTPENLAKYGLIHVDDIITYQMRWETIILQDYQLANGDIYNKDLLHGYEAYQIKFTDMIQGTMFSFVDSIGQIHKIMVGATGAYEVNLDSPVSDLRLITENNLPANQRPALLQGSVTFSIMSAAQNIFDTITTLSTRDIPLHQVFGPNQNILEYYNNLRRSVSRIYYARFSKLEVREVYSELFGTQIEGNILNGVVQTLIPSGPAGENESPNTAKVYDIPTIDKQGQMVHTYYRYWNGRLYMQPHFDTVFHLLGTLDAYTLYKDGEKYYRLVGNQLIENKQEWLINIADNTRYNITYTDLVPYVVYLKKYYQQGKLIEEYYKYTGSELIKLDDYSTLIHYGDVTLDVADKDVIYIEELDIIPSTISIGSGVSAELGLQVKHLSYNVEQYCAIERNSYEKAFMEYNCAAVRLKSISKDLVEFGNDYFIWRDDNFYLIQDYELDEYLQRDITFYVIQDVSEYLPQSRIDELYREVIRTETVYIAAIQAMLDAQKNGVVSE